jgi:hypothetical protein
MKTLTKSTRIAIFFAALLLTPSPALFQSPPVYKYSPPAKLNDGIKIGTLRSAKIDEAAIVAGTTEILKGTYPNTHSLLIFRHGKLVYENYFKGEDFERGVGRLESSIIPATHFMICEALQRVSLPWPFDRSLAGED